MRKILTGGLAALTLIGTIAAATDAGAASRRGDYRRDNSGSAIAAGALGLALGAALAGNGSVYYGSPYYGSSYRPYYRDRYYDRRYYAPRSYYRTCESWRWDPYYRRNVLVRYAC